MNSLKRHRARFLCLQQQLQQEHFSLMKFYQSQVNSKEKSKKKLEEKGELAARNEEKLDEELQVASRTLSDANKSLKLAIQKKDNVSMTVA